LLPVDAAGDRRHHDRSAEIGLPEFLSGLRIERVEISLSPAGEEQIRRRRQHAGIGHVELRRADRIRPNGESVSRIARFANHLRADFEAAATST
jgi:hypothetical protein